MKVFATLVFASCVAVAGCSNSPRQATVIHVPADVPTIQRAVDTARRGDLVLIAPGTYHESVVVAQPGIVIRGVDRSTTILDGQDKLPDGFAVTSDQVVIENLTVHSYTNNGVLISGGYAAAQKGLDQPKIVEGYRISYVTAYNNGLYGLYGFMARYGVMDHDYVSGHPDSGIYIGQCSPCDAVVTDSIGEFNSVGYEGTNAGGNLFVVNSVFRHNRVGITPNSQRYERLAPQRDTVIAGNAVIDNAEAGAPEQGKGAFGIGIAIGGGGKDLITHNLVAGHVAYGIGITDLDSFSPENNRIEANTLDGNSVDLAYFLTDPAVVPAGNCFVGNVFTSSVPKAIEQVFGCKGSPTGSPSSQPRFPVAPKGPDYRTVSAPGVQPNMPDVNSPAVAAAKVAPVVDVTKISTPKRPS